MGPNTGALALRARQLFPISYTRFCTRSQATNHSAGRYGDGAVKIPRRGDVNLRAAASDVARPRYAACMRPSVRGAAIAVITQAATGAVAATSADQCADDVYVGLDVICWQSLL